MVVNALAWHWYTKAEEAEGEQSGENEDIGG